MTCSATRVRPRIGSTMLRVGSERIIVGPAKLPQGFLDTNMLVFPTRRSGIRGGYRISEREGGPGNY